MNFLRKGPDEVFCGFVRSCEAGCTRVICLCVLFVRRLVSVSDVLPSLLLYQSGLARSGLVCQILVCKPRLLPAQSGLVLSSSRVQSCHVLTYLAYRIAYRVVRLCGKWLQPSWVGRRRMQDFSNP